MFTDVEYLEITIEFIGSLAMDLRIIETVIFNWKHTYDTLTVGTCRAPIAGDVSIQEVGFFFYMLCKNPA